MPRASSSKVLFELFERDETVKFSIKLHIDHHPSGIILTKLVSKKNLVGFRVIVGIIWVPGCVVWVGLLDNVHYAYNARLLAITMIEKGNITLLHFI